MNAQNAKDYLPLIQALAEGKTIQLGLLQQNEVKWQEISNPDFTLDARNYRIKPEKKVGWINVSLFPDGKHSGYMHDSKEIADSYPTAYRIACIRIEYEEGEGL
jgi:hypothetical protein